MEATQITMDFAAVEDPEFTYLISVKGYFNIPKVDGWTGKGFIDMDGRSSYNSRVFKGTEKELEAVLRAMYKDETYCKVIGVYNYNPITKCFEA